MNPLVLAFAQAVDEKLNNAPESFKKEILTKPLMAAMATKYGELENSLMYPGINSVLRDSAELAAICVRVSEVMGQLKPAAVSSLKLYHLEQTENTGYDTYSDCVVAAETEELARLFLPNGDTVWPESSRYAFLNWASKPENVKVTCLGVAGADVVAGVICASYHAG